MDVFLSSHCWSKWEWKRWRFCLGSARRCSSRTVISGSIVKLHRSWGSSETLIRGLRSELEHRADPTPQRFFASLIVLTAAQLNFCRSKHSGFLLKIFFFKAQPLILNALAVFNLFYLFISDWVASVSSRGGGPGLFFSSRFWDRAALFFIPPPAQPESRARVDPAVSTISGNQNKLCELRKLS